MAETKKSMKILLVDDEKDFLKSTSKALDRRGFEVKTAENANDALNLLEGESFDVAVLDVRMPGMPGDQLFREIKRKRPGLPMIILTGHGTIQQAFNTSREGIFDYLIKPCDVDKLAEVVRQAVESRRRKTAEASKGKIEDIKERSND
jgi:DNA-binding NtrC family response regulator